MACPIRARPSGAVGDELIKSVFFKEIRGQRNVHHMAGDRTFPTETAAVGVTAPSSSLLPALPASSAATALPDRAESAHSPAPHVTLSQTTEIGRAHV
jgi:hypothetical protein